jgi:hypothetical protein
MKKIILIVILIISNFCVSQHYHDTLVFKFADSIWKSESISNLPIINLDSTGIDSYRKYGGQLFKRLEIKFGYVIDKSGIYLFVVESSDLKTCMLIKNEKLRTFNFPKDTYFKLAYFFDGEIMYCFKTHEMWSGDDKSYMRYLNYLKSKADYDYKEFNLPLIVSDDIEYSIRK